MSWQQEWNKNITDLEGLGEFLPEFREFNQKYKDILERYPMSITRYYLSLVNPEDKNDPIRRMCVPSFEEFDLSGQLDTSGERYNTVLTGLQHKYPQTVLILSTELCAMYCRHCFRKRMVGLDHQEAAGDFNEGMEYIESHPEITNVLVSGGDAFLNSDDRLEAYLKRLSAIDHLDFIRFGTRLPVVFPQRIAEDDRLLSLLKEYNKKKQIYIVTQFNHPREITEQSRQAIRLLQDTGAVIRNQTVLLKGVNDCAESLGQLLRLLTAIGATPYYVFQCRPVKGVKNQFQVPLRQGVKIVDQAKNMQNGQGKGFRYVLSNERGKLEILGALNQEEMLFRFHQAKDPQERSKLFSAKVTEDQTWMD